MSEKSRIEYWQSSDGWRYRVIASNGQVVDKSEEGFSNKSYALNRAQDRWPFAELTEIARPVAEPDEEDESGS